MTSATWLRWCCLFAGAGPDQVPGGRPAQSPGGSNVAGGAGLGAPAGVSTSAPAASSESGFAEAMRVVGLHLEEMNRRQAAQELAASHRDATIIETILQLKQQMGGRLTRWRSRRGRWRMPTIVEAQ
eukprot:jgi/Astpho2/7726/Aster-02600